MSVRKGFWTGFGLALLVFIIPMFWYMDARSSARSPVADPVGAPVSSTFSLPRDVPPPMPPPVRESPADPADAIVMVHKPVRKSPTREVPVANEEGFVSRSPIRTLVYDESRLYTLKTALSHVTIVDLPEDAREVYVGDSKLFLAEVLGSRIKVKPITYDINSRTNMIVYTQHDRLSFRLMVVPAGEEDDLLSFRLPKSETVVNLNPIKTVIRKKLKEEESRDLLKKRRDLLKASAPEEPLPATYEGRKIAIRLLGFTSQDRHSYALIDCHNDSSVPLVLTSLRLRRFTRSLLWETSRHYEDGLDWSRELNRTVPPGGSLRLLLSVESPSPLESREGFLLSGNAHFEGGARISFEASSEEGGS